jgi:enamine deaminase RidA (YjgF/YER057c/UK114 family)
MRGAYINRSAGFLWLFVSMLGSTAWGDEARLSISGYDPVAYFTDGKPVQGSTEFEYVWHDAHWRFASAAHRDLFVANPEHYAPQYDGYCAMGASLDKGAHKDTVDPNAWAIVDGKLYLTHTTRSLARWQGNAAENIKRADENWSTVVQQAEPVVVGPPCRVAPPTVVISFKDGARRLLVGAQVAADQDGNIVGRGDMKAQVEQASKNIQACLTAAGANVSDILLTRTYVTDPDAFNKSSDVFVRDLGPKSPDSTVATVPKLSAGTDFLVEIEAVAGLNPATSANAAPKQ